MDLETTKSIISRALAFTSTLVFSLAIVNSMPEFRERRQRNFAQAAMDGKLRRMQLLHLAGANVNEHVSGSAPLFLAAGEGRLDVVRYLLDEGANVNAHEKSGDTALTEATYNGQITIVKELLFRGADVNAVGTDGTPLDIAIKKDNQAVADLLKHHGGKRADEIR